MSTSRILSVLALAVSIPAAVFADKGNAGVTSIQGQARQATGDAAPSALEPGAKLQEGASLETGSESAVELTMSNGTKLVLVPNTRIRFTSLEQSANPGVYSFEVVLLRGGLRGDATKSSPGATFAIRTGAGKVNVAGSSFGVDYTPTSLTAGNMNIVVLNGMATASVPASIAPIAIPAGSQVQVGQGAAGAGTVVSAPADVLDGVRGALSGSGTQVVSRPRGAANVSNAPAPVVSSVHKLPDFGVMVVSPNGEGATN